MRPFPNMLLTYLKETDISDWRLSEYKLTHKNGVVLWIANGRGHFRVEEPEEFRFTFIERWILWRYVKRLMHKKRNFWSDERQTRLLNKLTFNQ